MILWYFYYFLYITAAEQRFQFRDDDYIQYRTLPQHRITKWNITYYDRTAVAPGYWFTAPYWQHDGDRWSDQWIPYQIGPHIFDQDGVLVWAGSAENDNRNAFDFRSVDIEVPGAPGEPSQIKSHLAWMLWHEPYAMGTNGSALIYDSHYNPMNMISIPHYEIDTHEFNVKGSSKALIIRIWHTVVDLGAFGKPDVLQHVDFNGFAEVDLVTGQRIFEWMSDGKVDLDESFIMDPMAEHPNPDYMHANSIDKNIFGDYLLSARHTNTIYLISGEDGRVLWRLGGKKNDFTKNFEFTGQHDAKFISVNETHFIISFLDNGAIDLIMNEPTSSALYVALDLVVMSATVLHRYVRPDGGSTERRGNMQTLSNQNVHVTWSWNGYMSEFSPDGRLLMEASFASDRLDTYRAYKFPWVGRPSTPPTVVSECHGVNGSELSTVFYVSWNGATDVAYWRFYARANSTSFRTEIGLTLRKGFETSFTSRGYMDWVSVDALDSNMDVLGTSLDSRTLAPVYWAPGEALPRPDNPSVFFMDTEPPIPDNMGPHVWSYSALLFGCALFCTLILYRRVLKQALLRIWSRNPSLGCFGISVREPSNSQDLEDEVAHLIVKAR